MAQKVTRYFLDLCEQSTNSDNCHFEQFLPSRWFQSDRLKGKDKNRNFSRKGFNPSLKDLD